MNLVRPQPLFALARILLSLVVLLWGSAAHWTAQVTAHAGANEVVLTVDPSQSKVHWTLGSSLHTVHGTFAVKRGILRLDPASGKASGEISADATSGQSGNESRDKKMHKEILESARYTEVVFRPDRVDGKVPAQGSVTVQLHGTFLLHGSEHEMTVPVEAELAADRWKGTSRFTVPYIQWGLKNPSNFLLKANKSVDVDLVLAGEMRNSSTQ
jgi:polyisoprenoid-binding protein YceI